MSLPFGRWTDFTVGRAGSSTGVFRFSSDTGAAARADPSHSKGRFLLQPGRLASLPSVRFRSTEGRRR